MKKKLLVYGNCQANPLAGIISIMAPSIEIVRVPAVHTIKPTDLDRVFGLFGSADIIVHQPIGPTFDRLATDALKAEFGAAEWISFPSIFFSGVFPQLVYLRKPGGGTLAGPLLEYHDRRIVGAYLSGEPQSSCVDRVSDDHADYAQYFELTRDESLRREDGLDVRMMDVILDALRRRLPLHTFNHPDNQILWTLAERVLKALSLPIDGDAAVPQQPYLNAVQAAVPAGVADHLSAPWTEPNYRLSGNAVDMAQIVSGFYKAYDDFGDFAKLVEFNRHRFGDISSFGDLGWKMPAPVRM